MLVVSRCAVDLTYLRDNARAEAIKRAKQNMLVDLYANYPSDTYNNIRFQYLNDEKEFLFEQAVKRYQRADGMWIYNGDFVTFEKILNIVREDFRIIVMTAEI